MKILISVLFACLLQARVCDDIKVQDGKLFIHFSDFTEKQYLKVFNLNKLNYQFIYKNSEIYEIKSDELPCNIDDESDKKVLENVYFK